MKYEEYEVDLYAQAHIAENLKWLITQLIDPETGERGISQNKFADISKDEDHETPFDQRTITKLIKHPELMPHGPGTTSIEMMYRTADLYAWELWLEPEDFRRYYPKRFEGRLLMEQFLGGKAHTRRAKVRTSKK